MPARHRVQGGMVARSRCRLLIFIALGAFPCAAGTAHLEHVVRRPGAHSAALDAPPPPHALDEAYAHRTAPVHRLKAGSPWWRKTRSIGAPQGTATKYILLGTGALEAVDRLSRSLFLLRAPIRGWIVAPEACAGGSGSAQNWKVQSVSGARAVYSDGRAHNLMALESVALPEMQCTGPGLLLVGQCGSDAVSLSPAVVDALEDRLSDDTTSVVAALNPEILEHAARRIDWATCRICHIGGGSPVETKLAAAAASEGGLELGGTGGGPLAIESWDSVESAVQSLEEELGMGLVSAEDMKGTRLGGYGEGQVPDVTGQEGGSAPLLARRGRDVKRSTGSRGRGVSRQSQPVSHGARARSRSLQGCVAKTNGAVKRKVPKGRR